MDENYLAHHQVKGARWGVRHGPPYPIVRGAGGRPKVTHVVKSKLKDSISKRKVAKEEKKEATAAEKHEQLKREVIRNPKKIYKNKDAFSKSEIDEMKKQIEYNRSIEDIRLAEIKRGQDKLDNFANTLATTAKLMNSAKTIYNLGAELNNLLVDTGKKSGNRMTKIGEKPTANSAASSSSKPDTSKKMSSPEVSSASSSPKVQKAVKKAGKMSMMSVDDAFSRMNLNGPMGFYGGNPEFNQNLYMLANQRGWK